jgi:hypothetical protein
VHLAERVFHLAVVKEIDRKKEQFDCFIEPEKLQHYGLLYMHKAKKFLRLAMKYPGMSFSASKFLIH